MGTILVRRATTRDAAAIARMMGHPEVLRNLMQLPYASEELWRARLADNEAPGKTDLLLAGELDGEVVASAGLHPVGSALRRRHAMMLGISVLPEAQGKGVGTALMQALVDYADRWGQVLRIELDVYTDNARAIALYTKFGFEREGLHRGYALRDGAYVDSYSMARLHPAQPRIGQEPAPQPPGPGPK